MTPGGLLRLLALLLLRGEAAPFVRGDLEEGLRRDVASRMTLRRARARYLRNLLGSAWSLAWARRPRRPSTLSEDTRLALRTLWRSRAFTIISVLTLALGISAATSVFSVVQGVLLSPLPYPDADRIVRVALEAQPGVDEYPFSEPGYRHFLENNRSFETFGGYGFHGGVGGNPGWRWRLNLADSGPPQEVTYRSMTPSAFEVLGVQPQLGRLPTIDDEGAALISHGLWVNRYGSDPAIIGRPITQLNSRSRLVVIGVMPEGFDFPSPDVDLWTLRPFDSESEDVLLHDLLAIARLAQGVTIEEATAEANALVAGLREVGYQPERFNSLFSGRAIVRPLKAEVVEDASQPLLILLGTAVFVLLIACGNVASLLLVRAEARSREHAVRVALGSGRGRLIQFIMMESVLLVLAGGLGGVGLAHVGTKAIIALAPASIPRLDAVGINGTVLLVATLVSITTALLFGLLPAMRAGRESTLTTLSDGGRGSTIGRERNRALSGLVIAQMALAVVLLVGSGLMVRSFQRLTSVESGFDAEGVVTFGLNIVGVPYSEQSQFYDALRERLEAIPGVIAAGAVYHLPLTGEIYAHSAEIHGFPVSDREVFLIQRTTPGYFDALGIPILEGRDFLRDDDPADYSQTAFIVSSSLKQRYWPNESALEERITYGRLSGPIVGVVGDVHYRGLHLPAEEVIYEAHQFRAMDMAVRATGDLDQLIPEIRAAVAEINPDVPITDLRTMEDVVERSYDRLSFTMTLLAVAAGIALLLGAIGIYGVVTYVASRRSAEMGVRLALGADPGQVQMIILARGMLLAGLGALSGLVASILLGRVLQSLLFGIDPLDLPTLLGAAGALLLVAAASSIIPARSAAKTSPASVLKAEG